MCAPLSCPPRDLDPAETVALLLAGLFDEGSVSTQLGMSVDDLRSILQRLDVDRAELVPVRIEDRCWARYLDVRGASFNGSLFDDVVDEWLARRAARQFRVPLAGILRAGHSPSEHLGGLILHSGRSGSTLLCNLLAGLDDWVVVQEPEVVNTLLRVLESTDDADGRERWGALVGLMLHSLAHGVWRSADGRPRRCAVKLTSWNAAVATELWRIDSVPLVALVRDPWASVESLLQDPPYWYTPPKEPVALAAGVATRRMETVSAFAVAWSRTVEALLRLPAERTIVLRYDQLTSDPVDVAGRVSRHFGHEPTALDRDGAGAIARTYSKGTAGESYEPRGRHAREALHRAERELVTSVTAASWAAALERTGGTLEHPRS